MRKCKSCGIEKPLDIKHFNQNYNNIKGERRPYFAKCCKTCTNKKDLVKTQKYKQKNRKKLAQNQKIYYKYNKQKYSEYKKQWYLDNKASILIKIKKYINNRRKTDICFKLKERISNRIRGLIKSNSIVNYLPYTIQELKNHLESLFEPWMSWDNYGVYKINDWNDNDCFTWKWQIDHIIPYSTFNYSSMEDQSFRDCWALSNLRPLSAKQNVMDGNRR